MKQESNKIQSFDIRKYIFSFIVTTALFLTAFYLSNYFGGKKIQELQAIEKNISLDILSSETQYDLLGEISCKNVDQTILSNQINELASKLTTAEVSGLGNRDEVVYLKKYYSLLQIKDYTLSKKLAEKCGKKTAFIIYIYGKEEECPECRNQASVLDSLKNTYPDLRVYAFDYNLDVSAIKTLLSIYKVNGQLPALIVNEEVYYGYKSKDQMSELLPKSLKTKSELEKMATTTSTTTVKKILNTIR